MTSHTPVTARLERAVTDGAEALFAARRDDGVVDPGGDRFSPANTAAVLVALHAARAHSGAGPHGAAAELHEQAVKRLYATQRPDGGWAMDGVPTETLTTSVVASALALTAPDTSRTAVAAARALVRSRGGAEGLPEPAMAGLVRQFEAMSGARDPASLPRLPLELLLAPGLARRTLSLRLPIFSALALGQSVRRGRDGLGGRVDKAIRPRAAAVVREAFERERSVGSFSGDPWLTSLITLGVARAESEPDIVRAATDWLSDRALPGGGWALMPLDITWSSFAGAALLEAGYAADPRLVPVRDMFRKRQQDVPFTALACPEGHWGFSTDRSWPMALETAEISSLLRRLPGGAADPYARRGIRWLTTMQDRSGSWSLAVRDSRPGGFGPCPQMTAKAVLALLECGAGLTDPRVLKSLRSLARKQRSDGALEAMWYRGLTPGTSAALVAFARAGRGGSEPARRARGFLLRSRLPDGSWGTGGHDPGAVPGTVTGTDGPDGSGGTVEETAWALHALLAAGEAPDSGPVVAAARWLLDRQETDGSWPGSAVNEYVRHCYRYPDRVLATALAVKALGRMRTAAGAGADATGAAGRGKAGTA
ncbi:prenyltransferase/squalene oxidase repeat-containing protein [Streptomyces sp. Z26]|uniref:prenyltransferase/squalene oxidase repeat-containing protein n=1 Tax=Streptomyces sp. Z26 TaxID=2500177 RepID=UPI000EF172A3|nr:prenyltransferase/squalene oxidase repeat-containing protein [Streptomyces sp. Z26]RLL65965.1 prenyltransferase [Streptomyces sp. Z26]